MRQTKSLAWYHVPMYYYVLGRLWLVLMLSQSQRLRKPPWNSLGGCCNKWTSPQNNNTCMRPERRKGKLQEKCNINEIETNRGWKHSPRNPDEAIVVMRRKKRAHNIVQQVDNILLIDRKGRFPVLWKSNIEPVDTTEKKEKHKTKKPVFNPCLHRR